MKLINLISDTVTKPCANMRKAMGEAEVGDDVFRGDPTVAELETYAAEMFGKEAALFCPSGTMTNQIAIKMHTRALDEIICDETSHVYLYETGGYSFNSSVAVNLIKGVSGKITPEQIVSAVKPLQDWLPISKLVVIENSCNRAGGSYYSLEEMQEISKVCKEKNLKLHLDGARLFNVITETKMETIEIGGLFDSISICLSKGLGAPVGSLLISSLDNITEARRFRKVMGGGMRQAGIIAAGGLYALRNNVDRLSLDNQRAKALGATLRSLSFVTELKTVYTNIVIFDVKDSATAAAIINHLKEENILIAPMGSRTLRLVTHLDLSQEDIEYTQNVLRNLEGKL